MVGRAVVRRLAHENCEIITATRSELDLRWQIEVEAFFGEYRPQIMILAAAKVGEILANDTYPVDSLLDNLVIETNVIDAAASLRSPSSADYTTAALNLIFGTDNCR